MRPKKSKTTKFEFQSRYPNIWSKLKRVKKNRRIWQYSTNSRLMNLEWDEKTNSITMVDPEGGPSLSVGDIVGGYKIVKMFREDTNIMFEMH
jgi:hypothetical protein